MEGRRSPLAPARLEQQHGAPPGSTPAPLIREGSWAGPQSLREEGRPCVRHVSQVLVWAGGKDAWHFKRHEVYFKVSFRTHSLMSDHWDIWGSGRGQCLHRVRILGIFWFRFLRNANKHHVSPHITVATCCSNHIFEVPGNVPWKFVSRLYNIR